ncbi:hypothetical protein AgCh_008485 [Apium graveolens]
MKLSRCFVLRILAAHKLPSFTATDGRENLVISMQANMKKRKGYHNISGMDIPSFRGNGMSGTARRHITNYGISRHGMEEISRHFCREPIGPSRREHTIIKSHIRWHSGEGNYKEFRDYSDAKMLWERERSYGKSQNKSYRSRSRSPAYHFNRASVNDRRGRITTYNFRNDKPHSTSTIPCKFFATGYCRNGSLCRFSHNGLGEQKAMRSYADGNAATGDRLTAHWIDTDELTKDNARSHSTLTAHSSSGMVVSESGGTATCGADIEGSRTCTENHLLTLNGTSKRSDILDPVKSEAASSNQFQMGSEQISRLTNTLVRLSEDEKQIHDLRAALRALNTMEFMQSFLSASAGEQPDGIVLTSQLLLTSSPEGDGLHGIDCKKTELNVNSLQSSEKALLDDSKNEISTECKNEKHILMAVGMNEGGVLMANIEIKKNKDGKSFRAFKFSLAEFVKELLYPTWKEGHINKEAYKTGVKNVVDKVIGSVQSIHILQTKEKINKYLSTSKPKILKLI